MRILVSGGAGFIGSAFVRRRLAATEDSIVVVDKLTYAGNPANLAGLDEDRRLRGRYRFVQADILRRTNRAGRISITATEMLESMTHSRRPTRAEVTDVANAVLSGTDAVMLSAETAIGEHPVRVVEAMASICREVEQHGDSFSAATERVGFLESHKTFASAVAKSATEAAANLGIETIVAFTESGGTALLLSKYRPPARIMAFAVDEAIYRRMVLYWGVTPIRFERRDSTDRMIAAAEKHLEKAGICQRGDGVVMVAGVPPNQQASTNLIKLHVVGERLSATARMDMPSGRQVGDEGDRAGG